MEHWYLQPEDPPIDSAISELLEVYGRLEFPGVPARLINPLPNTVTLSQITNDIPCKYSCPRSIVHLFVWYEYISVINLKIISGD